MTPNKRRSSHKGERSFVATRLPSAVVEQAWSRAEAAGLTMNDYLKGLILADLATPHPEQHDQGELIARREVDSLSA